VGKPAPTFRRTADSRAEALTNDDFWAIVAKNRLFDQEVMEHWPDLEERVVTFTPAGGTRFPRAGQREMKEFQE
jgi:hypothetical protein